MRTDEVVHNVVNTSVLGGHRHGELVWEPVEEHHAVCEGDATRAFHGSAPLRT
jgi:hypothetical protein